jgi:polyphosphate kinase
LHPRLTSAILAVLLVQAPAAGQAHPHIFIDGGVDFRFDAEGRLAGLQVTWIYDAMTSLLMLDDLGIDGTVPLEAGDRQRLAAYQTSWEAGFDGDSYLRDGDRRIALSGPLDPGSEIRDGKVVITFRRDVEMPFHPGTDTVAEIYEPTYFTAYAITETPRLEGGAEGCRAEVVPFRPSASLRPLLDKLGAVPIDATPDEDLGRLFADKVRLTCD